MEALICRGSAEVEKAAGITEWGTNSRRSEHVGHHRGLQWLLAVAERDTQPDELLTGTSRIVCGVGDGADRRVRICAVRNWCPEVGEPFYGSVN